MAHELIRLTSKLYDTPHLISETALNKVMQVLEDRNNGDFHLAIKEKDKKKKRDVAYNPDTLTGMVSVSGPLTYIEYEAMCGEESSSYQQIRGEFDAMLKSGAKTIVMDIDSPGGEAYQAFETARYIREQADKHEAKIISYVDGLAASAAYALASVSDEIVMNPMAEVGSIGVVVKLRNVNKAMQQMGIEDTYVYAGKSKVPFTAEGEFSESFLEDLQSKVDVLYGHFVEHISKARGMSEDAVVNTEAKTFLADRAIELKLADKQMTVEEFSNYLADLSEKSKGKKMPIGSIFKANKPTEENIDMSQLEQLQASLEEMQKQLSASQEKHETLLAAVSDKESALAAALEQVASLQKAQADAKAQSRLDKLKAVAGESQAVALAASLASLEDEAFNTVLSVMETKQKAVEESDLFVEKGANSQPAADKQEDKTAALLKAKYAK